MKRSMWQMTGSVLVIAAGLAMPVLAQNQGGFQGPGGGQGGGFRNMDPAQMQQQQNQVIKDAIGATDQEWTVLGPKIQNIQQLQYAAGTGAMSSINQAMRTAQRMAQRNQGQGGGQGGGFGQGGRGGGGPGGFNIAQMMGLKDGTMQARLQDLQTAMDNETTSDQIIRQKLEAVREARNRARADLDKARKDLIDLLTTRQEAALFELGILE